MKKNSICDCKICHQKAIDKVLQDMPQDKDIVMVSKLFKVLGDYTRIRIMFALIQSEMCVGDICVTLDMTKSAISHQLSVLKEVNLVKSRRDGKEVYYSVDDFHVSDVIEEILVHIKHSNV